VAFPEVLALQQLAGKFLGQMGKQHFSLPVQHEASQPPGLVYGQEIIRLAIHPQHPCQALADMVTIKERFGNLRGRKVVYLGDGNNVCNSLLYACAILGVDMVACCPATRMPNAEIMLAAANIAKENGSKIEASHEPLEACKNADVLYTDTRISMGDTTPEEVAIKLFSMYQINDKLLSIANPECIVMHCLPAHRGQEITNEVIEGPHSVVFDQAENRLHAQKAVLYTLMKD
jgi:ornithine carbamoyltransferase